MKYKDCLQCKQLGNGCDGPNLLFLSTPELGQWLNELRKQRGISYDKTSLDAGASKTAVYNLLKETPEDGTHPECRIDTARMVAKTLIGGDSEDNPCGNVSNSEKAAYEERIRQLEHDIEWQKEKAGIIEKENTDLKTLVANTNKRHTESQQFMRGQIRDKNKAILTLSLLLGVCVLLIIAALVIDNTNPDVGFFWLRSWLGGSHSPIRTIGS